ncbi:MAG: hypothetical protein EOP48_11770 [Sphingobacteriales bacterium]|nr:MAG: hypothetical protein EOP48_11770 [Sphingobacteriales bacterium]
MTTDPFNDTCFVYDHSDSAKLSFVTRDDDSFIYGGLAWYNTRDAFVGDEYAASSETVGKTNIVSFDLSGKIIDRIYEAEYGERALACYPSRDDKYLIFTSEKTLGQGSSPLESLAPMVALGIIDLSKKEVIVRIDSFGRLPNIKIKESPWLQSGYRFVYSMDGTTQFILEGEEQPINPLATKAGVYIFDVASSKSSLLVPDGFSPIASPVSNQIAYEKDHCVIVRDFSNNTERVLYKYKSNEKLLSKHWAPDGKAIFISYLSSSQLGEMFKTSGSKLIDVVTGDEFPFKHIGMMYGSSYTWK